MDRRPDGAHADGMTDFSIPIDALVASSRVAPKDQVEEQAEPDTQLEPFGPGLPGNVNPIAAG